MGYGQYSIGSGRLTKDELLRDVAPGYLRATKWGHNRLKVVYADRTLYRLHHTTVVAVYRASGAIAVNTGGFDTITTKRAIAEAIRIIMPGAAVSCFKGSRGQERGRLVIYTDSNGTYNSVHGPIDCRFVFRRGDPELERYLPVAEGALPAVG